MTGSPGSSPWGRAAVLGWLAFAAGEGAIRLFDLYRRFPHVDVPSHVLSGVALGATFLWALERAGEPRPYRLLATLGVALMAGLWEAMELVDEAITPDPPHLRDRFVWDGAVDVLVTTAAGALAVALLTRRHGAGESDADPRP
ncbi:MAG: hypothetical protein KY453_03250 [Gemmatimonadetes bacterium]|nr:hypothetical protein [Gemmatimonadota bacterium]